jgi:hypothetical protein
MAVGGRVLEDRSASGDPTDPNDLEVVVIVGPGEKGEKLA